MPNFQWNETAVMCVCLCHCVCVCVCVCVWRGSYGGPVGRGCHDVHIRNLRTCTHAHLGFADLHIRDLQKCKCHVVATWQPRGNNCTSANRVCASPQIPDVHVCTSANCVCARHDSRDLPGHRRFEPTVPGARGRSRWGKGVEAGNEEGRGEGVEGEGELSTRRDYSSSPQSNSSAMAYVQERPSSSASATLPQRSAEVCPVPVEGIEEGGQV